MSIVLKVNVYCRIFPLRLYILGCGSFGVQPNFKPIVLYTKCQTLTGRYITLLLKATILKADYSAGWKECSVL